jgi:glycosyltransferase involved in cell wall biosynthesis
MFRRYAMPCCDASETLHLRGISVEMERNTSAIAFRLTEWLEVISRSTASCSANRERALLLRRKKPEMAICREPIAKSESEDWERPPKQPPVFSIIIPVRNEEKNILTCLDSLRRIKFAPEQFEVIVVDNGSTDQTPTVVSSFACSFSLKILYRPNVYISTLRNAGAAAARGQYLAFLDADCEVQPDWLSIAAEVLAVTGDAVVGSFYRIPEGSSWVARNWYQIQDYRPAGEVSFVPSGDLFVSHELFDKIHGFDESIQTNEDYEFCQRIRAARIPVICEPRLGVVHWGTPQSLLIFFKKNRWHGMHVFRVFLTNLPSLHNLKAVAFALYMLLCVFGSLGGAVVSMRSGDHRFLGIFLLATLCVPLFLGIQAAVSSRRPLAALPMAALYFTYALARACCIVDWRNWVRR